MTPMFELGRVTCTPAAQAAADVIDGGTEEVFLRLLARHQTGDWSEMDPYDRKMNADAVAHGQRVLSAYTVQGTKFWVITEWNRTITTILLPEDY